MAWYNFFGKCVLSSNTGSGETFYVLPAADVSVKWVPWIRSGGPIIDLLDGTRKMASTQSRGHIDVEINWEEVGEYDYPALMAFVKAANINGNNAIYKFYPKANAAGTGIDPTYAGVEVVPEMTGDLIGMHFEDRVRQRKASLVLKGRTPMLVSAMPTWMNL